jgi:hypothetical protein
MGSLLALVPSVVLAQAGSQAPPPWQLERTPEVVRLARTSQRVDYRGAGRYYSPLVFECRPASKTLSAHLESTVKTAGSFTTRFDDLPAVTHPGKPQAEWQAGARQAHVLRIPKDAMPAFLNDARTSKTLMFRHEFSGIPTDVLYDLTGFEKEFAPVAEACGIGPATARTVAAAPKAPRPVAKPDREIGPWLVRESVSTVDDRLIVVVFGTDTLKNVDVYIRCRESAVEAFFVQHTSVFMADKAERVTIDVAVDGGTAVRHRQPTTPLNKAAFVNDGREFVSALTGGKTMTLTYTPWHKPEMPDVVKTATFSLAKLDEAVKPVLAACAASAQ